ncbi:MAG: isocitrate/isopropylmalate dehydrogenase family protein [Nitrososphaerota archaeon]
MKEIAVIPGDGIGPEVISSAIRVLESLNIDIKPIFFEAGYNVQKSLGHPINKKTIEAIKEIGICLKGPTYTPLGPESYKSVAVTLRQELDLYANVRPIKSWRGIKSIHENVDLIIIRENTEGLYKGFECDLDEYSIALRIISLKACERIAKFAFEYAIKERRKKITAVHKANILKKTCGLFLETFKKISKFYPSIEFEDMLIDAAAYNIVLNPKKFDVIVTTNLFGDILSDEAAGIAGSLGLAASANIGEKYALFEPVHGVAFDIAGKGIANPIAAILSLSMLLKYIGYKNEAIKIEKAIEKILFESKNLTPDLGGSSSTNEVTEAIIKEMKSK